MDTIPQELQDMHDSLAANFYPIREMAKRARENLQGPSGRYDADHVERLIRAHTMKLGQQLMSSYFQGLGLGDLGFRILSEGREYTRRHRASEKTILTSFGTVRYQYSLYTNGQGESLRPLEAMANLPERGITYLAQELMTRLGVEETYAESQDSYRDFFGYSLSSPTIEEVVKDSAEHYGDYQEEKPALPAEPSSRIGVVSFDGKGVNGVASERTSGKTREALLGCAYTIEPEKRDTVALANFLTMPALLSTEDKEKLQRQHRAESIHYFGSIARSKEQVFAEVRQGADERFKEGKVTRVVCLMDGALHLWSLAKKHFPQATFILDIMHVLTYLRAATAALHTDKKKAQILLATYLQWILQGQVQSVIKSLQIRLTKNRLRGQRRKDIQAAITYFLNHQDYMQYDRYLAAGCPMASGVIESACKHIVKTRLEKAGAQWSIIGAESVLRLRCIRATGHWQHYFKIRQRKERNRLYYKELKLAA